MVQIEIPRINYAYVKMVMSKESFLMTALNVHTNAIPAMNYLIAAKLVPTREELHFLFVVAQMVTMMRKEQRNARNAVSDVSPVRMELMYVQLAQVIELKNQHVPVLMGISMMEFQ